LGQDELHFDATFQVRAGLNALGRLGARPIELAHDAQLRRMLIDPQ
jgi:hypothetical protein